MLSYRHGFHAGNHADVLKHATIAAIIDYLNQKPGPIHYIDTHAGAGIYRLDSEMANKTAEYRNGIAHLWDQKDLPPVLAKYVETVKAINPSKKLLFCPGSPQVASLCLRPGDKLHLCELHSTDQLLLLKHFRKDKRVSCYAEDGFKRSLSLVPPISKRGLVVIDPSYEMKEDYARVVTQLQQMHKRFATGIYALWYPLVDEERIVRLEKSLQRSGIKRIQLFELGLTRDHRQAGMTASGMIVINPPWTLKQDLSDALQWLSEHIEGPEVYWRAIDLVGE